MSAVEDSPIIDWTGPLYQLKNTWAQCDTDVAKIAEACAANHRKPATIDCPECHATVVNRVHRVFKNPPPSAWFAGRTAFLADLDSLFARARVYQIDMQAISDRISAEKMQWYHDMVTQYPLLIAALESAHSADGVARLLGSDREVATLLPGQPRPPVEFDFAELSEAVASAIGLPKGRNIGPHEVARYAEQRWGSNDSSARNTTIDFLFRPPPSTTLGAAATSTSSTSATDSQAPASTPAPAPQPLPATERYAQMYQTVPTISIERLLAMIESDLCRAIANTPAPQPHGAPLDRRRALGLGTATPLTPKQRNRVDDLVRIIDAHNKRTADLASISARITELQRAKRANEEEAARKKREKAAAEEKRRAEAIRAAEVEARARARAAETKAQAQAGSDKMDVDDPNKIPAKIYDQLPCRNCKTLVDPKDGPSLGCAICVLGVLSGRVEKQTLYCSEACYIKGHEQHVQESHPCESGSSCIRISSTASVPASSASTQQLQQLLQQQQQQQHTGSGTDSNTAVACLMCDVRLKRNSFFCCLACAKSNKDAHIANFHRDAFPDGSRGMPKTVLLEDFLAKRMDVYIKGAKMEFPGKR